MMRNVDISGIHSGCETRLTFNMQKVSNIGAEIFVCFSNFGPISSLSVKYRIFLRENLVGYHNFKGHSFCGPHSLLFSEFGAVHKNGPHGPHASRALDIPGVRDHYASMPVKWFIGLYQTDRQK